MNIIWATDGSRASQAVLPYLRGLFNQRTNKITVLTAVPAPVLTEARPDPSMLLWNLVPDYRERVSEAATDLIVREVQLLAGLRAEVTSNILLGSPPVALLREVNARPPDLLLMGAHGHSGVRDILVGSVTRQVAVNAACSVLVARARRRPRTVLVAYDGSPDAEAAIDLLARIPATGVTATVLAVVEPPVSPPASGDTRETLEGLYIRARMSARSQAAAAARRLRNVGWSTNTRIRNGHPRDEILQTATDLGADLVVVGARGVRSPHFNRQSASGLTQEVLDHAPCAVLIARAG